jgi:protein O-mannosyl-transferase
MPKQTGQRRAPLVGKTGSTAGRGMPAVPTWSWSDLWIIVLLAAAIITVYSPVVHFDFVTYDDPDYVTANPHVQAGLTLRGVAWAFTNSFAGNWFPLTWLSHMLDCQMFGLDSGWHHFTNALIHSLSTLLLFGFLKHLTGARWKSALVAFLFALHPLHVESVAWVAERKDVLSAFFWILTMWSYAIYIRRPGWAWYVLTLAVFCLGLMAKPMLVTLPIVLLLVDYWPLNRGIRIVEKLPFFAVSMAVSLVTYVVHEKAGATASVTQLPPVARLGNSLVSYIVYIIKVIWPAHLAFFYPYPHPFEALLAPAALSGIALAVISIFAWRVFRQRPYFTFGWLWYVATLLPVIGLIQVGDQARADRYAYVPTIGLTIALVWGTSEALQRWPRTRLSLAVGVCTACVVLTWLQLYCWRDSVALYRHAIAVTSDNYVAHFNLAAVLAARGERAEAIDQLREAVQIRPYFAMAHGELGELLAKDGQAEAAVRELQLALTLKPDSADNHFRLGSVLGALGRSDAAAAEFTREVQLDPDNADGHYNLGIAKAQTGKLQEAAHEFSETVRLRPEDADARFNLGIALLKLGRFDESIVQFSEAIRIRPGFSDAREELERATALKQRPRSE